MAKYRIEVSCTKTEIYEIEAVNAEEAEENLFLGGKLIDAEEEAYTLTSIKEIK